VERIQAIADRHNLKVIYDAAHAFGVKYKGQSLLNYGDLSILSFHATKVFNTMEGGAIISHSAEMKKRIDHLKNFGFENEESVVAPGINSKMNEMQAALGLLQLKYHKKNIKRRKLIADGYIEALKSVNGISFLPINPHVEDFNYSYFPIFVNKNEYGLSRDELYNKLRKKNIFVRRYFYPSIVDFQIYNPNFRKDNAFYKVSEFISEHVITLPIYPDLPVETQNRIIDIIRNRA
jgi:dTDP-4-amino-4,6-dideoxygalactose transaminase